MRLEWPSAVESINLLKANEVPVAKEYVLPFHLSATAAYRCPSACKATRNRIHQNTNTCSDPNSNRQTGKWNPRRDPDRTNPG